MVQQLEVVRSTLKLIIESHHEIVALITLALSSSYNGHFCRQLI